MRFSRVSVAGLLTGLSMLGALACGEGSVPTVTPVAVATLVPSVPETPYAPPPTATPWPTFTPVPPLPTLRPTPTGIIESVLLEPLPAPDVKRVESPASTPDVQATAAAGGSQPPVSGPLPTPEVVESVVHATPRLAPTAVPGPYPTPYGQLVSEPEGEVRFLHQTLFPLQTAEVPASYQTGQPEDLPDGVDFVSQSTRFVLWVVMYDVSDAPEDWRWTGLCGGTTSTGA